MGSFFEICRFPITCDRLHERIGCLGIGDSEVGGNLFTEVVGVGV